VISEDVQLAIPTLRLAGILFMYWRHYDAHCTVQVRSNCRFNPQVSVYIVYESAFVHLFIINW
jgi:hypothetical protein